MTPQIRSGKHQPARALAAAIALLAGAAMAQDVDIRGDGSSANVILQGKNINPNSVHKTGVQGVSEPAGGFGIGVRGLGGQKGVEGLSTFGSTGGFRYGVYASASGSTFFNYGLYSLLNGTSGVNVALHAQASGTNSRGVFGSATGVNSRAGYFSGSVEYTGSLIGPSDSKLKKNIAPLRNCVSRLTKLSPKEFEYRSDEFATMHLPGSKQLGLIAQDVEAIFPDLVEESVAPEAVGDAENARNGVAVERVGYKGVNYIGLIPVLIGAIKEQQEEINALKKALQAAK